MGLAFSVIFLVDSNNNRKEVRKFQDRFIDTFKSYDPNLWARRLAEIRRDVEDLKNRQLTMGVVKFLVCGSFRYFAYASTASVPVRTAAVICSATSGTAAVINGVDYYNLHELIERLQRDGLLN